MALWQKKQRELPPRAGLAAPAPVVCFAVSLLLQLHEGGLVWCAVPVVVSQTRCTREGQTLLLASVSSSAGAQEAGGGVHERRSMWCPAFFRVCGVDASAC
mgnify:FL=1